MPVVTVPYVQIAVPIAFKGVHFQKSVVLFTVLFYLRHLVSCHDA